MPIAIGLIRYSALAACLTAGLGPKAAVERSRELVDGRVRAFGVPLLLLTLAPRAVLTGRHWLLAALPPRLWTQVMLHSRHRCCCFAVLYRRRTAVPLPTA